MSLIREMQIKTKMRYHLTSLRVVIINKSTNNKCWQGSGERRTFSIIGGNAGLVQPLWKAVWRCLKKLKVDLPFDPAFPLIGSYPKEIKTLIHKNISTRMFIAALFTIPNIKKQPMYISK